MISRCWISRGRQLRNSGAKSFAKVSGDTVEEPTQRRGLTILPPRKEGGREVIILVLRSETRASKRGSGFIGDVESLGGSRGT